MFVPGKLYQEPISRVLHQGIILAKKLTRYKHASLSKPTVRDKEKKRFYNIDNRSIPPGVLCGLDGLRSLNLSFNHLLEVSNVGLSAGSSGCQSPLVELDLSNNVVSSVSGDDLKQAPELEILTLANNRIGILADDAFSGLVRLKEIDLSGNQVSTL